nr:glycosyltransferase [Brachybacterium sp. ACRRE]
MPVVLALTAKQAQDYRATFGAENCDPIVIPNVIRDRRSSTSIRKVRGRVGVVCRLHAEQKRVDDLLRAWVQVVSAVPAAHLEIGGDGGARRSLEQLTAELGLQESVTFHGWVPDGADLMASCILTASAARWEGLPLSIGESLAAETPVVAYDINYGPSDLIREGRDGILVPDGDVDRLAQGIIKLLKHPRSAAKMGRSASRRMAEEFSMEAIAPKWKAAFEVADRRS